MPEAMFSVDSVSNSDVSIHSVSLKWLEGVTIRSSHMAHITTPNLLIIVITFINPMNLQRW